MPVQYPTGVIAEHMAVRQKAGLFDVSHMGELLVEGQDALKNLQWLVTADLSAMTDGQVKYAMLCNEQGGVVDDLVVCRLNDTRYLLVVNAGNREKDAAWVLSRLQGAVQGQDISDFMGQVALQGPLSRRILEKVCAAADIPEKYYHFTEIAHIKISADEQLSVLLSRTGYTGELGYELYCRTEDTQTLWNALLAAGRDEGLLPCGLGARDTLRLEAAMPLYGHELSEEITPREAGLPCKLDGKDFLGRAALLSRGDPTVRRVGLRVTGRGIVREGSILYSKDGREIGHVSSGTYCPYLEASAAMGYVSAEEAVPGRLLEADVRGRRIEVAEVPLPFYRAGS